MYRVGVNTIAFSAGGTATAQIDTNVFNGVIGGTTPAAGTFTIAKVADGTLALPSIVFAVDPDTGFYRVSNGRFDAVNNGVSTVIFGTGSTTIADLTATTADINGGTIDGTAIGGTTPVAGTFTTASATTSFRGEVGSSTVPAFSFRQDTATGIYRSGSDELGFTGAGALHSTISSGGIRGPLGSSGSPTFSFRQDTLTGMYRSGSGR